MNKTETMNQEKQMNPIVGFIILSLLTFVGWYIIVGFVLWEGDWITRLANVSGTGRLWFVGAVVLKVVIDFWLWSLLRTQPRKKSKQRTYIYDENNEEINYQEEED